MITYEQTERLTVWMNDKRKLYFEFLLEYMFIVNLLLEYSVVNDNDFLILVYEQMNQDIRHAFQINMVDRIFQLGNI